MRLRARARTALVFLLLALCAAPGAAPAALGAAPAAHAAPHAAPRDDAPAAAPSRTAYLAAQLRKNPVYISDQIPRSVPRSAAPAFAKQAERTGVPTYLLVLPSGTVAAESEALLAAVHDRLGRDGLYVLLEEGSAHPDVATFGVDVPAESASRATLYELPFDAGGLRAFTHFVDVLEAGDREAARRAESAADEQQEGKEPPELYISDTDREDQSSLTGLHLTGVPLLILLLGWLLKRNTGGRWVRMRYVGPLAGATALVIALGAPQVFDETRSSGDQPPTARDLTARIDRVAESLRSEPVYADVESAPELSPGRRAALSKRIAALDVPVRIAVVPMSTEDESGGESDLFAESLHRSLRKEAVYVVAAPDAASISVVNYGARLNDAQLYDYTEEIRYAPGVPDEEKNPRALYEQLNALIAHIEDIPAGPPGKPYLDPDPAADPLEDDVLPPLLYSDGTWAGAQSGVIAAALVTGVAAAVVAIVRRMRGLGPAGRTGGPGATGAGGKALEAPYAPARPGTGWLRRTARRELGELNAEFDLRSGDPGDSEDTSRIRAWKCLDAATLLLDQQGDRRVDSDADAPTLATAIVLLRAGRAALAGESRGSGTGDGPAEQLCSLNPLHGPAVSHSKFKREGMDRARSQPVCVSCRTALTGQLTREAALRTRLLRLRAERSGPYLRYDRLPGPLGASGADGITTDHLVDNVLEHLGVH